MIARIVTEVKRLAAFAARACVIFAFLVGLVFAGRAGAQYLGAPAIGSGGLGKGIADTLYCALAGCTLTGPFSVNPGSGSNAITVAPSVSMSEGINMRSNNISTFLDIGLSGQGLLSSSPTAGGDTLFVQPNGVSNAFRVKGPSVETPATGIVIANPTDVATTGFQSCTFCKISAAAATAWTPQESGQPTQTVGTRVCFQNTGTFVITMTASANVYVGPGSALGQNDVVCMQYTDSPASEWVETNFQNNP